MVIESEVLILKMVSGEMRPAQEYSKEAKKWIPIPGKEEKYFEYILVTDDLVGEKVVFNSKLDFTKLEGKKVTAKLSFSYDNFNKKMKNVQLVELVPAKG